MANAVQSSTLAWLLSSITSGTVKCLLIDTDYTYSAAHDFLDDVAAGARVGTAQTLTVSASGSQLNTSTSPTFTAVSNPQNIQGVWVYLDAGSDATRRLLAWYDRKSDNSAVSFATDGGNVTLSWSSPLFTI